MKIKEGFELRNICGENIVIGHGVENINFTKVISMNESAADIWQRVVGKEFTLDDMVKALTDNYDVDAETARRDSELLLKDWTEAGFIED
ncbi:MAG: PqqD family protein [Bacteroidaceae bacterium]|nr:PqqD family protein [Bacteroidaceae bacterium]MBR3442314.1 PqqD family protein [Bacteroidaceae bacterium]